MPIVDLVHVVEPDPSFVGYIKADDLGEQQLMVDPLRGPSVRKHCEQSTRKLRPMERRCATMEYG